MITKLSDHPALLKMCKEFDSKKNSFKITDVTPDGFGPEKSTGYSIKIKDEKLSNETLDQFISRKVGYQIENGLVTLESTMNGWQAKVLRAENTRIIIGFKKQDVLNQVFNIVYPEYA